MALTNKSQWQLELKCLERTSFIFFVVALILYITGFILKFIWNRNFRIYFYAMYSSEIKQYFQCSRCCVAYIKKVSHWYVHVLPFVLRKMRKYDELEWLLSSKFKSFTTIKTELSRNFDETQSGLWKSKHGRLKLLVQVV